MVGTTLKTQLINLFVWLVLHHVRDKRKAIEKSVNFKKYDEKWFNTHIYSENKSFTSTSFIFFITSYLLLIACEVLYSSFAPLCDYNDIQFLLNSICLPYTVTPLLLHDKAAPHDAFITLKYASPSHYTPVLFNSKNHTNFTKNVPSLP